MGLGFDPRAVNAVARMIGKGDVDPELHSGEHKCSEDLDFHAKFAIAI